MGACGRQIRPVWQVKALLRCPSGSSSAVLASPRHCAISAARHQFFTDGGNRLVRRLLAGANRGHATLLNSNICNLHTVVMWLQAGELRTVHSENEWAIQGIREGWENYLPIADLRRMARLSPCRMARSFRFTYRPPHRAHPVQRRAGGRGGPHRGVADVRLRPEAHPMLPHRQLHGTVAGHPRTRRDVHDRRGLQDGGNESNRVVDCRARPFRIDPDSFAGPTSADSGRGTSWLACPSGPLKEGGQAVGPTAARGGPLPSTSDELGPAQ